MGKFGFKSYAPSDGSSGASTSSSSYATSDSQKNDSSFWRKLFGINDREKLQTTTTTTNPRPKIGTGGSVVIRDRGIQDRPRVSNVSSKHRPLPSKVYVPPGSRFQVTGPQGGRRENWFLNKNGKWEKAK